MPISLSMCYNSINSLPIKIVECVTKIVKCCKQHPIYCGMFGYICHNKQSQFQHQFAITQSIQLDIQSKKVYYWFPMYF